MRLFVIVYDAKALWPERVNDRTLQAWVAKDRAREIRPGSLVSSRHPFPK